MEKNRQSLVMSRRQKDNTFDELNDGGAGGMVTESVALRNQAQGGSFVKSDDDTCCGHIQNAMQCLRTRCSEEHWTNMGLVLRLQGITSTWHSDSQPFENQHLLYITYNNTPAIHR